MQGKNAGGTPAAPIKLDVSVRVIEPVKNLMGFASVKFNDCFVVENLKIVQDVYKRQRLSLVDLPSANSMKCCSPPASLEK